MCGIKLRKVVVGKWITAFLYSIIPGPQDLFHSTGFLQASSPSSFSSPTFSPAPPVCACAERCPGAGAGHRSILCSASRLIGARLRRLVPLFPVSSSISGFLFSRDTAPGSGEFESVLPGSFRSSGCRLPLGPALPCGSRERTGRHGGPRCVRLRIRGRPASGRAATETAALVWRAPDLERCLESDAVGPGSRSGFLGLRAGALGECAVSGDEGGSRVRSEE